MPNGTTPTFRKGKAELPQDAASANHASSCPIEKQLGHLLSAPPPPDRFDLTRGYLPIAMAAGLMLLLVSLAFTVGGELQKYKQVQSSLTVRIEKVETKLDRIISSLINLKRR